MTMANEISRRGQPRGGGSRESPVEQQELRALKHANREWLEERSPNRRVTSHAPMHGGGRTHSQGVSPKRGVLALYLGVFTLRKYPGGGRHVMWLHVVRFGKKHRGAFPLWEYDRDAGILRLVVPVESPESGKTHPSSPIIIPFSQTNPFRTHLPLVWKG